MRTVSTTAAQIAAGDGRSVRWVADLFYGGNRTRQDLPIASPSLRWDGDSQVAGTGKLTVVWQDAYGNRLSPVDASSELAPYGAELQVDVVLSAGVFSERVALGRFVVTSVPTSSATPFTHRGRVVYPGEAFEVQVKDLVNRPFRNRFAVPESPASTSAWAEAQRLSGLPVLRNVADGLVPATVTYDGNRADALDAVFSTMQAWPMLTSSGLLTARPFSWPASVGAVATHDVVNYQVDSADVYNQVVVEGKSTDGTPVRAIQSLVAGPLRTVNADGTPGPYGVVPYFYKSDFITSDAQAQAEATRLLARVSRPRAVRRAWSEPFNPLREVGDVLSLNGELVRARKVEMTGVATKVEAEVQPL